jgi:hypothetical protein
VELLNWVILVEQNNLKVTMIQSQTQKELFTSWLLNDAIPNAQSTLGEQPISGLLELLSM